MVGAYVGGEICRKSGRDGRKGVAEGAYVGVLNGVGVGENVGTAGNTAGVYEGA